MRIVFAGTPEFAAAHLKALIDAGHNVVTVMSQPDRPAGRGRKLAPTPVKQVALDHDIPVWQPLGLKDADTQQQFRELNADVMVVVAYGLILPKSVLDAPTHGCINVHGSLLPAWRGAAPIQRAIMAGDTQSGVTIMQMDEGLDTGDMLLKAECAILPTDSSADLHDRLITVGCPALIETLQQIEHQTLNPVPQDNSLATYAHKLSKDESLIDWSQPAQQIHNCIRGLYPWPVAFSQLGDDRIRILTAEVLNPGENGEAGKIVNISPDGVDIQCGVGQLRIRKAQLPGGKALDVRDLINSKRALFEARSHLG